MSHTYYVLNRFLGITAFAYLSTTIPMITIFFSNKNIDLKLYLFAIMLNVLGVMNWLIFGVLIDLAAPKQNNAMIAVIFLIFARISVFALGYLDNQLWKNITEITRKYLPPKVSNLITLYMEYSLIDWSFIIGSVLFISLCLLLSGKLLYREVTT